MTDIESFLSRLRRGKNSDRVYNPYRKKHLLNNLRIYLNSIMDYSVERVLLVGEAPGYKGCRITGIPFTSSEQIINSVHPFFLAIRSELVFEKLESENSATIVWDFLQSRKTVPLCWNSFPFHPFKAGDPNSNRAPSREELTIGLEYLQELITLFKPDRVAGIGRKGEGAIRTLSPEDDLFYIRHPSHGGKNDFIRGMERLIPN
ncbi:uracil-DNA glycosylase [Desulfosediminicola sp.]|uniref:uracil-DNA glycosylase n=1 Tax=Desulfosediminicola sp. TaxID=2886825 RepID=UPI003AF2E9CD